MTHEETFDLGEAIAVEVLGRIVSATVGPDQVARMTVLVGHQIMLIAQVLADAAGLDFAVIFAEELDRATRWHERVAQMMTDRERLS